MSFVIAHPNVEGTAVIAERALAAYAAKGWLLVDRAAAPADPGPRHDLPLPARSASAAEWKTYAVAVGMPYEDAVDSTRDELADHYNPAPKADTTPPKPGTPGKTTQES